MTPIASPSAVAAEVAQQPTHAVDEETGAAGVPPPPEEPPRRYREAVGASAAADLAYEAALRSLDIFRDAVRTCRTFVSLAATAGIAVISLLSTDALATKGARGPTFLTMVAVGIAASVSALVIGATSLIPREGLFFKQEIESILALQHTQPAQAKLWVAARIDDAVEQGQSALRQLTGLAVIMSSLFVVGIGAWMTAAVVQ